MVKMWLNNFDSNIAITHQFAEVQKKGRLKTGGLRVQHT